MGGSVSPLHASLMEDLLADGFAGALAAVGLPDPRVTVRRRGHRYYIDIGAHSTEDGLLALAEAAAALPQAWKSEQMPRIRQQVDAWRRTDLGALTLRELALEFEQRLAGMKALYATACAARLAALWWLAALGQQAGTFDDGLVSAAIRPEDTPGQGGERVLRYLSLRAESEATELFTEIEQYLQAYGHARDACDIAAPTWAEEPERVLAALQQYRLGRRPDPVAALATGLAESERARAALLAAGLPERLLAGAREAVRIWEYLGFWVESAGLAELRRTCLELGRRLCRSAIVTTAEDVFWLTVPELLQAAQWSPPRPWRRVIAARQQGAAQPEESLPDLAAVTLQPYSVGWMIHTSLRLGAKWVGWREARLAAQDDTSLVL